MSITADDNPASDATSTLSERVHRIDAISGHLRNYIVGASFGFVGIAVVRNQAVFVESLHLGSWNIPVVSPWSDIAHFLVGFSFALGGLLVIVWNALSGFLKVLEHFGISDIENLPVRRKLLAVLLFSPIFLLLVSLAWTMGAFAFNLAAAADKLN